MRNGTLFADGIAIECDGMVGSIETASSPEHAAETREVAAACREDLALGTYASYLCINGKISKLNRLKLQDSP